MRDATYWLLDILLLLQANPVRISLQWLKYCVLGAPIWSSGSAKLLCGSPISVAYCVELVESSLKRLGLLYLDLKP